MSNSGSTSNLKSRRHPQLVNIPNNQLEKMRKKKKKSVTGREGKFSRVNTQSMMNALPQNNNYVILQHNTANALFLRNQVAPGDIVTTENMTFYYYDPTELWHYPVAMGRFIHKNTNNEFAIQAKVKLMIPKRILNNAQVVEQKGNNVNVAYNRAILSPFMQTSPTYSGLTVVLPPFSATVHAVRSHETIKQRLHNVNIYYDPLEYALKFRQFVSSSKGRLKNVTTRNIRSPWENGRSPPHWMNRKNVYRYRRGATEGRMV